MPTSSAPTVTAEKLQQTKEQIREYLRDQGIFSSLKAIINDSFGASGTSSALAAAQHKSVAQQLASQQPEVGATSRALTDGQKPMVHVLFLGGRAFPQDDSDGGGGTVCACLQLGSQRFRSASVPMCAEPALRDGVLLELPLPPDADVAALPPPVPSRAALEQLRGFLHRAPPMHLLVLQQTLDGGERLLSSSLLEWRQVLHKGKMTIACELPGVGAPKPMPVGILELKLELLPTAITAKPDEALLSEAEVLMALKKERDAQVEAERKFFAYARSWWASFLERSPSNAHRPVKLFAMSEFGTQRPVTAFVSPLRTDRLLETPHHAAHFVSLLAHTREDAASATVADVWRSTHATLALKAGETEEHATLLCSLLLGFGLDAYVAIGTDERGPHVWVLTRDASGSPTFWESLTGAQYVLSRGDDHPYVSIACLFSDVSLYANVQPSSRLDETSLDVGNTNCWLAMDSALLSAITPVPLAPLQRSPSSSFGGGGDSPSIDHVQAAIAIEGRLKTLVDHMRLEAGIAGGSATWDEELAHVVSPALFAYEHGRLSGGSASIGGDLFSDAVRRFVPRGHTFKGFPQHVATADAKAIADAWGRSDVARDIVYCRAVKASLAVRVRVFPFPDGVVSVWAMLAMAYQPENAGLARAGRGRGR